MFAVGRVTIDELRRYDLVLPTVTQRVGQEIETLLAALGLAPTASLRSSSYGFIREMLHGTDLISIMPRLMMAGDLVRGTLGIVPPDRRAGSPGRAHHAARPLAAARGPGIRVLFAILRRGPGGTGHRRHYNRRQ